MNSRAKTIYSVIAILLVFNLVLLINVFVLNSNVKGLSEQIKFLINSSANDTSANSNLDYSSEFNELKSAISSINKKQNWVNNAEYKIIKTDNDMENATVLLVGSLKELDKNSDLYMLVGTLDYENKVVVSWEKQKINDIEGLSFKKKITLSYLNNYKLRVVSENKSNSRSEKFLDLDLNDLLNTRMIIDSMNTTVNNGSVNFEVWIENMFKDKSKFKIKDIFIESYIKGEIYQKVQIYKNGCFTEQKGLTRVTPTDYLDANYRNKGVEGFYYKFELEGNYSADDTVKLKMDVTDYAGVTRQYTDDDSEDQ